MIMSPVSLAVEDNSDDMKIFWYVSMLYVGQFCTMTAVVLIISAYTMKQHVLTGIEMAGKNGVR
jgi:hypothetical protein